MLPTLVAVATATSTLRLGTWVMSPNYRHPVTTAKDLMTLDDICGGRLIVAVGAGGTVGTRQFSARIDSPGPGSPGWRARSRTRSSGVYAGDDAVLDQIAGTPVDGEWADR